MSQGSLLKERIKSLTEKFDKIVDLGLVPIDNITKEDIEEYKRNLEEQRFTVSFCGQIKAGKSTLLNALIFKDNVLPAADTPLTAKLTVIRYGEKPKFEVEFYNTQEWEKLKNMTYKKENSDNPKIPAEKSYFDDFLKEYVEKSIRKGIYAVEVINDKNKTITEKDFSKLWKYVGADGIYTPFVKQVNIYYPSEFLKQIDVVDTPGTNDPNKLRSRVTLDWIKKSDAVVYVVYAGRAFDSSDINFIDKYLFHVPSDIILFAVNKIDTIKSLDEVKEWVEKEVSVDKRLRKRHIMSDPSSVVYVSALGGLLDEMDKNGKEIPKNLEFDFDRLDEKSFLDNNNVDKLKAEIEKKIIKTKNEQIFQAAQKKIESVFRNNEVKLKSEIIYIKEEIDDLSMTGKDIEKRERELSKERDELSNKLNDLRNQRFSMIHDDLSDVLNEIKKIENKIIVEIKERIKKENSVESLVADAKWDVKNVLYEERDKIWLKVGKLFKKYVENLKCILEEELLKINKNVVMDFGTFAFDKLSELDEQLEKVRTRIEDEIGSQKIDSIINETTNWPKRTLAKTGIAYLDEIKSNIQTQIEGKLKDEAFHDIKELVEHAIPAMIDKGISEIEIIVNCELDRLQDACEKAQSKLKDREKRIAHLREEMAEKQKTLKKIEVLEKEILR